MTEPSSRLDQLIQKASAGDRASLEALLLHFHDPLLQFIRKSAPNDRVAWLSPEDVLQETFVEVFRRIGEFEPRGSTAFLAWLKLIAHTRLINLIKTQRAKKRGGGRAIQGRIGTDATATSILNLIASREPTPSRIVRRKEAIGAIATALEGLDPVKRQIIELRYGQGMSVLEVAKQTGKGEAAVKMVINRAMNELRRVIGDGFGNSFLGM